MTGDSLGSAQIGAQQIYDLALATSVKVDVLLTQHSELAKDSADHEVRIRAVEEVRAAGRLAKLEDDVDGLKARQWPLPAASLLIAAAALAVAIIPVVR